MAVLIIFVFFLRPSEAFAVRCMDLVAPRGSVAYWTLVLHPFERGLPSKTGEFDETVMMKVEYFNFVVEAAGRLLKAKAKSKFQALLRTSAAKVNTFLRNLVAQFELEPVLHQVHRYRLRHGGASHMFASGLLTLQEVLRQGRWRSAKSLRRYEKGERQSQILDSLPSNLGFMESPKRLMEMLRRL